VEWPDQHSFPVVNGGRAVALWLPLCPWRLPVVCFSPPLLSPQLPAIFGSPSLLPLPPESWVSAPHGEGCFPKWDLEDPGLSANSATCQSFINGCWRVPFQQLALCFLAFSTVGLLFVPVSCPPISSVTGWCLTPVPISLEERASLYPELLWCCQGRGRTGFCSGLLRPTGCLLLEAVAPVRGPFPPV
jgi:hypothetical protein